MTAPNMAAITSSLERSLQNCSLNHHHHSSSRSSSSSNSSGGAGGGGGASNSDLQDNQFQHDLSNNTSEEATLELNSHVSLPYHWEQCLDLKTGEIYYINWRTGMKAKEDPRKTAELNGDFSSEDDSSYDSEESSTESSPSSSREKCHNNNNNMNINQSNEREHVLVVAGCKSCLMYFMVPKQVEDCPKCCGQLLHFDRSENGSP